MFLPRTYNCRTPENFLKCASLAAGLVVMVAVTDWESSFFHKRGSIPPIIHGRSLPNAMVHAASLLFTGSLIRYGGPSILQFFKLRIEVQDDGLHYVLPDYLLPKRGFARWDEIKARPETPNGLTLLAGRRELLIPKHVGGYSELVQEIRSRCPASPEKCLLDEKLEGKLDTDPALLNEVQAAIISGRKQEAVEILTARAGLDVSISRFYVNDWAQENIPGEAIAPSQANKAKLGPVGLVLIYAFLVVFNLLWP